MIRRIVHAVRVAPYLSTMFLAALALTLWFGGRATMSAIYWADPAHRDEPIAGWMTPGYVSRSWEIPPEVVAEALGLTLPRDGGARPPPLEVLAGERGVPLSDLVEGLEEAITAYRATPTDRP